MTSNLENYNIRQENVPKPIIAATGGIKDTKLIDSTSAFTVEITAAPGLTIRYTANGTAPKCRTNPVGTVYSAPIRICGSPRPILLQAVACKPDGRSGEAGSEVASETFRVQAFEPPPPHPPGFLPDPASAACSQQDGTVSAPPHPAPSPHPLYFASAYS